MKIEFLEKINQDAYNTSLNKIDTTNKVLNSQYFTPMKIGEYMSSMFKVINKKKIKILDPGSGIGNLTLALVSRLCHCTNQPEKLSVVLYELDQNLIPMLEANMVRLKNYCLSKEIEFDYIIKNEDFIFSSVNYIETKQNEKFDYIIMNPPYKKLNTDSLHNRELLKIGIDVPNYYAAFMALSCVLLNKNAQMVCIVPRSFCNGSYFEKFRKKLVNNYKFDTIHLFGKREGVFYDDVLQETLIIAVSNQSPNNNNIVNIVCSVDTDFSNNVVERKRIDNIVFPTDEHKIIRIIQGENTEIVNLLNSLPCTLADLGIQVSTGPIVDFRQPTGVITEVPNIFSLPIIYAENIRNNVVHWPIDGRKPGYINQTEKNSNYLRPPGIYVVVKRMSSKEEPRRIVAGVYDSNNVFPRSFVAFDNKVNYYHINKTSLKNVNFAYGLSSFLNSTLVDFYFRSFSGSTQVNVSDLKQLRYPCYRELEDLGRHVLNENHFSEHIDEYIRDICNRL